MAVPVRMARPPRGTDPQDWMEWAEEVERVINLLLAGSGQTYAATNVTPDRTYDADATTLAELSDIVGTLIADLRTQGIVE